MGVRVIHENRYLATCVDCPYALVGSVTLPMIFTDVDEASAYADRHAKKYAAARTPHRVIIRDGVLVHAVHEED